MTMTELEPCGRALQAANQIRSLAGAEVAEVKLGNGRELFRLVGGEIHAHKNQIDRRIRYQIYDCGRGTTLHAARGGPVPRLVIR